LLLQSMLALFHVSNYLVPFCFFRELIIPQQGANACDGARVVPSQGAKDASLKKDQQKEEQKKEERRDRRERKRKQRKKA
jgi:hypothetical protein